MFSSEEFEKCSNGTRTNNNSVKKRWLSDMKSTNKKKQTVITNRKNQLTEKQFNELHS